MKKTILGAIIILLATGGGSFAADFPEKSLYQLKQEWTNQNPVMHRFSLLRYLPCTDRHCIFLQPSLDGRHKNDTIIDLVKS